ncbi:hypothetical protein CERZMDRAFT_97980 [Cercospora zeae-maydis SCOH1-5]|uniref:Uncharacterized protein n=1 Tax=Cercospora zeae-maydis SCOH1-5 TaxID=717836 RepID=A0A6A6FF86_9PEZI|nr:hypothetical protein CERZMDRAFT_97980 [Cercospora zeae-maydis SCOH1-5]
MENARLSSRPELEATPNPPHHSFWSMERHHSPERSCCRPIRISSEPIPWQFRQQQHSIDKHCRKHESHDCSESSGGPHKQEQPRKTVLRKPAQMNLRIAITSQQQNIPASPYDRLCKDHAEPPHPWSKADPAHISSSAGPSPNVLSLMDTLNAANLRVSHTQQPILNQTPDSATAPQVNEDQFTRDKECPKQESAIDETTQNPNTSELKATTKQHENTEMHSQTEGTASRKTHEEASVAAASALANMPANIKRREKRYATTIIERLRERLTNAMVRGKK